MLLVKHMENERKIKAALFDLDGTTADTEPLNYESWRIVFEKHGKKLSKRYFIKNHLGMGTLHVSNDIVPKRLKGKDREDMVEKISEERIEAFRGISAKVKPYKEAVDLAKQLKGMMKVALVTSSHRNKADMILSAIGLENFFDVIATADDVEKQKPDPGIYLLAAKKLGVSPSECIVFEDTSVGVESAKAAGMVCVAVPNLYTQHMDFSKADYVAKSLSKLTLESLEKIAAGSYAVASEGEIMTAIIKGFDWEDILTSIVVEHGLDPENIDISKLAAAFSAYLQRPEQFDFRIPARFVLVAAILLSMKVEAVLESEEERLSSLDTSALDVRLEAPMLIPPAERKATRPVNLTDLISALNKAFEMKQRKEHLLHRPAARLPMPIEKPRNIETRVKELYEKIRKKGIVQFSDLVPVWKRSEIISEFLPLLYLVHQGKVECRQEKMFREITIKLR